MFPCRLAAVAPTHGPPFLDMPPHPLRVVSSVGKHRTLTDGHRFESCTTYQTVASVEASVCVRCCQRKLCRTEPPAWPTRHPLRRRRSPCATLAPGDDRSAGLSSPRSDPVRCCRAAVRQHGSRAPTASSSGGRPSVFEQLVVDHRLSPEPPQAIRNASSAAVARVCLTPNRLN